VSIGVLNRRRAAAPTTTEQPPTQNKRLLLAACCVAQFMVILDISIVNVALPSIQVGLKFSSADLQWVVDAYAIMFAGFLMLAGRVGDHFGQRRAFILALAAFSGASLLAGLSPNSSVLIGARALQGLGGAVMAATSLAVITSNFEPGPARHRAIALWGAMNGVGGASGVLFGGIITQEVSWRWIFLMNVPIGIAAALVAARVVVDRKAERPPTFDFAGALVLTSGLLILAYGGVTAGEDGWGSASALVPLILGNVVLAFFGPIEKRAKAPLVPHGALTRELKIVNGIVLLFSAAIFPLWFMGSLYLQQVLSLSPVSTGLVFLPMALAIFVCGRQAGKLVGRAGVRIVLGGGLVAMTVGLLLLDRIGSSGSAIQYMLLPGLLVTIGIGFSIITSTIAATQSAKAEQAGLASGLVNTARQVGGGLGLAIIVSIASVHTSHQIGHGTPAPQALASGFRLGFLISAGLCAVAAILTLTLIPGKEYAPGESRTVGRYAVAGFAALIALFAGLGLGIPKTHSAPIGSYTTNGAYTFASAPTLHPPIIQSNEPAGTGAPLGGPDSYIMMANFYDETKPPMVGQSGPLILDNHLQPVWFQPVPTDVTAANLDAQTYHGKPVLSWWQGNITPTGLIDTGEYKIVDQHYRPIATIKGQGGWVLTLHSFYISGDDAWVTVNKNVPANLSNDGGVSSGVFVDSAIQEYNIKTGKLVYTWDAAKHIPLSTSYTDPPPNGYPWDAYHINSLNLAGPGHVLIGMRNTWAAYMVNTKTDKIEWTLGGKQSDFPLSKQSEFEWQHDVELTSPNTVTMFDDHCCKISGVGTYLSATGPSRGLQLTLNMSNHTVTGVKQYSHGTTFESEYMGSTQALPDGHVFVDWGQVPFISEFDKSGKLVFDGALPGSDLTYRAYVRQWVGLPLTGPSGAVRQSAGKTTVSASWNGATKLTTWKLLAGPSESQLTAVATKPKSGFETSIPVTQSYKVFKLEALDPNGHVVGTSRIFRLGA
jgi:EmrB/QacA subfamily drug resistance transporter